MARVMSDAELRRRKKVQGNISRTTSTLGLGGVGVGTAAILAAKKPGALKAIRKVPKLSKVTPEQLKDAGLYTSPASGGIGGVGGYNFAAYTNAESRKRKQTVAPVKKSMGVEMGHHGEEGHPIELPVIEVPIEKAWYPSASNYDPEAKRRARAEHYPGMAAAGGTAAAVGAGVATSAGFGQRKQMHGARRAAASEAGKVVPKDATKGGSVAAANRRKTKIMNAGRTEAVAHGAKAARSFKVAGGLGALSLAGIGGSKVLTERKRSESWQPYAKRDATSAFGIDHSVDSESPT